MINVQYKLVQPLVIEPYYEDLAISGDNVLVRPVCMSICKADLRYYFGQRSLTVLKERLPLVLIHEAVGTVLYDPHKKLIPGTHVIMLPNIAGEDQSYLENYRTDSIFRSSKADGFMQEILSLPSKEILPIYNIDPSIAALCELISVGVHAVSSFIKMEKCKSDRLVVFGDGAVGYVVACLLKTCIPDAHLTVVGNSNTKLELFSFADQVKHSSKIDRNCQFDHAFECVGGQGSPIAIQSIINSICPQGIITLLGVSEDPIPVETRMILEKGLTVIGRSRSTVENFRESIDLLENNISFRKRMTRLISDVVDIKNTQDIHTAFDRAKGVNFKVIMNWKI